MPAIAEETRIQHRWQLGYLFSAFAWSLRALAQFRAAPCSTAYGSRPVYIWSILPCGPIFTGLQAFAVVLGWPSPALISLVRPAIPDAGLAEAPCFPANARIVANWFPNAERGTAQRDLQRFAIFLAGGLRPADGLAGARLRLASVFLAMGAVGFVGAADLAAVVQFATRHNGYQQARI